jgi:AdoMet-dependent heme synthase
MNTRLVERPLRQQVMSKAAQSTIPFHVVMELTYRCNERCVHCYVDVSEKDELSQAEWQRVLDELEAAGTAYITFTGGEILVRKDLLEIAGYARRKGFFITLMTNASLITPDIAQEIARVRPFAVVISLYGAKAATHDAVTRLSGSFQRTTEGLKHLVRAGLTPFVQIISMTINSAEITEAAKLVRDIGAIASIKTGMTPSKSGAGYPFRYEIPAVDCLQPSPTIDTNGPSLCKAGRGICSISPQGNVSPCIMFPLKLGNLKQSSFDSIWRLEPCVELRYLRSMGRSDLTACRNCRVRVYCHRCTGNAYLASGRLDSPDPNACRMAEEQTRWWLNEIPEVRKT